MTPYVPPKLTITAHKVKGVKSNEPLLAINDRLAGTLEASSWLTNVPFNSIIILVVFDEPSCPPVEIVTIDEARNKELFVRCARSSADLRAAQKAKSLDAFFKGELQKALTLVAERYQLPPLALAL